MLVAAAVPALISKRPAMTLSPSQLAFFGELWLVRCIVESR